MLGYVALALLAYLAYRAESFLRAQKVYDEARASMERDLRSREVAIKEREIGILERRAAEIEATEPMPPDIMSLAMSESESWAQDNTLKVAREVYAETKDWNAARRALGRAPAQRPAELH